MEPIYLDYNATTPMDPRVIHAMRPFLESHYGNPSSNHILGIQTKLAIENARKQVADLLHAHPDEIVFTSGGTESNNYALKGVAYASRAKGNHIITTTIEHPAITEVCQYLAGQGFRITRVRVDDYGMVYPGDIESAITPETILISVMHANNEVGTIQPLEEIGKIAHQHGILFHSDGAQSTGKIPVDVDRLQVDLFSVAGHKLYAPKGIGVLYIRRGVKLEKLIHGADHESNQRAGTENVIQIVGLGEAASIVTNEESGILPEGARLRHLRDRLYQGIMEGIPGARLNGHPDQRLPNTLSMGFSGVEANLLLQVMKGVAASAGAACHADRTVVSSVLEAMNVPLDYAAGTIRFSLGRMTTENEIDEAIPMIVNSYLEIKGEHSSQPLQYPTSGIRLTEYTHALGCACKIRPQLLEEILHHLPVKKDPSIIVGYDTSDDAAVYQIDEKNAIVQTLDVIPPIVDDPYYFGAIAAANALSDIYAMGATPLFALSLVGFPDHKLPMEVLHEILKGANEKVAEAGIQIIGGHSIEDAEPKFGLAVTGLISPDRILRNSTARPGDRLILTKPIGTGILTTAVKRGLADSGSIQEVTKWMAQLNKQSAELMTGFTVNACTDITGFGLLGHLKEMALSARISFQLFSQQVPVIPKTWEFAAAGAIPGGTRNNLDFIKDLTIWEESVPELLKLILADAQTSGGLIISLPEASANELLEQLHHHGISSAAIIGQVLEGKPQIKVSGV